jgi:hypothetical protein
MTQALMYCAAIWFGVCAGAIIVTVPQLLRKSK